MSSDSNQIDWRSVLEGLEQDLANEVTLSETEVALLNELREIKAESSTILANYKNYHKKERWEELKQFIVAREQPGIKNIRVLPRIFKLAAACITISFIITGIYFYFAQQNASRPGPAAARIAPGQTRAVLTLGNGRKIRLDNKISRELAREAGVKIIRTADGGISYEILDNCEPGTRVNTLSTAKGETYHLKLPDGTKVWLNAASSIRYDPRLDQQDQRMVSLSGEAYFEVAEDRKHPFVVVGHDQKVEVLGTRFNVNNYPEDGLSKTTLLDGLVRINGNSILKPGQQAGFIPGKGIQIVETDAEKAIAWKNGRFMFQDESIESIMRTLARWYNVDVVFEDDVKEMRFTAYISRYDHISSILDKISYTRNIHFKIEGRRIIIMK